MRKGENQASKSWFYIIINEKLLCRGHDYGYVAEISDRLFPDQRPLTSTVTNAHVFDCPLPQVLVELP